MQYCAAAGQQRSRDVSDRCPCACGARCVPDRLSHGCRAAQALAAMLAREQEELARSIRCDDGARKAEEQLGRISGSLAWRVARGEAGLFASSAPAGPADAAAADAAAASAQPPLPASATDERHCGGDRLHLHPMFLAVRSHTAPLGDGWTHAGLLPAKVQAAASTMPPAPPMLLLVTAVDETAGERHGQQVLCVQPHAGAEAGVVRAEVCALRVTVAVAAEAGVAAPTLAPIVSTRMRAGHAGVLTIHRRYLWRFFPHRQPPQPCVPCISWRRTAVVTCGSCR